MSKVTPEAFISLVKQMRDLQKQYFKTRDYTILSQAREAEKAVDRAISSFEKAEPSSTPQTALNL